VPTAILYLVIFVMFEAPVPTWLNALALLIFLAALGAMISGVLFATISIAQGEPRWMLATAAGVACGGTLMWIVLLISTDF
jgi:hypothetical protein